MPDAICAAKVAAVGVDGDEGAPVDVTARTCVGNAILSGMSRVGRIMASREAGKCERGSEVGIDSKLTALTMLRYIGASGQHRE